VRGDDHRPKIGLTGVPAGLLPQSHDHEYEHGSEAHDDADYEKKFNSRERAAVDRSAHVDPPF
jgi:hypothetical protein